MIFQTKAKIRINIDSSSVNENKKMNYLSRSLMQSISYRPCLVYLIAPPKNLLSGNSLLYTIKMYKYNFIKDYLYYLATVDIHLLG